MLGKTIVLAVPGGGYVELPEGYSDLELVANVCVAVSEREPPPPPERLRINVKNMIRELAGPGAEISAEAVKLLMEKQLTASDLKPHHARLTLPVRSMCETDFLTDEEERRLATRQGKKVGSLDDVPLVVAAVIGGEVRLLFRSEVSLRRWVMPKQSGAVSMSYVLAGSWTQILTHLPHLQEGADVQIWSARVDGELWLSLLLLPPAPAFN